MSHGASPSPWWTLNAISPAAVRLVFGAEAAAAPATSASANMTATQSRTLAGMSTGPLCASDRWVLRQPESRLANVQIRRRGRHGGRGSSQPRIAKRIVERHHGPRSGPDFRREERERRDSNARLTPRSAYGMGREPLGRTGLMVQRAGGSTRQAPPARDR